MLEAIHKEIGFRKDYLQGAKVQTIYFGGGTPSLLEVKEIKELLKTIRRYHDVASDVEITLEANPDDLTRYYVEKISKTPVNRLSIGIQSFFDEDLMWMNRAHTAQEANNCILIAKEFGFDDITIDLIYGSPTTSSENWQKNLELFKQLDLPHLSAYALTVEKGTALGTWVEQGKHAPMDDGLASEQFDQLKASMTEWHYEQYEISNFAKPGRMAKHNTGYWTGKPYLGIGPSAHSFNGDSRQWNIPNNAKYMRQIKSGVVPATVEKLSPKDQFNEYVMTSLRCSWGISREKIKLRFPQFEAHLVASMEAFVKIGHVNFDGTAYTLNSDAKFLADGIASDLFLIGE